MATLCSTPNCSQKASMKCPKCVQLGIQDSFFCTQDCFKGYWKEHKVVHDMFDKIVKAKSGIMENNELIWPGYNLTGTVKPYKQSGTRKIPKGIIKPDYSETGIPESERTARGSNQIICLTEEEQKMARETCRLAREVLDMAVKAADVGVTTDEIDRVVHQACVDRNCYPSPLNYYNFPKSCCTSVNEVICHGIPDLRPLEDGDILNIDITVYYNGFHGDLNETIYIGKVDEASRKLVRTAYECLEKATEMNIMVYKLMVAGQNDIMVYKLMVAGQNVKPGTRYRDVGDVITKHATANNCSVVRTYCGHGIHRLFHCAPNVPHYSKNKAVGIMKPGHIFTIEPMINAGVWRDNTWPDNWTAVTADGKRSAQFEQTFLVTETGYETLTKRQHNNGRPYFMDQEEEYQLVEKIEQNCRFFGNGSSHSGYGVYPSIVGLPRYQDYMVRIG